MRSSKTNILCLLFVVVFASLVLAEKVCEPCVLCPAAYRKATPPDACGCKYTCDPTNCGGFAGVQCGQNTTCFRESGHDAGYCDPLKDSGIIVSSGERPPEDCVLCRTGSDVCASGSEALVSRWCDDCGSIVCKEPSDQSSQKSCVKCTNSPPACPNNCTNCAIVPQTCSQCSTAICIDEPQECVSCPAVLISCPYGCQENHTCVVTDRTCRSCGQATCELISSRTDSDDEPQENSCVVCAMEIPQCPTCAFGEYCVTTALTCEACPIAQCSLMPLVQVLNTPIHEGGLSPIAITGVVLAAVVVAGVGTFFVIRKFKGSKMISLGSEKTPEMASARPDESLYKQISDDVASV